MTPAAPAAAPAGKTARAPAARARAAKPAARTAAAGAGRKQAVARRKAAAPRRNKRTATARKSARPAARKARVKRAAPRAGAVVGPNRRAGGKRTGVQARTHALDMLFLNSEVLGSLYERTSYTRPGSPVASSAITTSRC